MYLAKGEKIIKSWNYATQKALLKKNEIKATLTVTNKRIVNTVSGKTSFSVGEIPLNSVKNVTGSFKSNKKLIPIIKLIIGIPLCLIIIGIKIVKNAIEALHACYLDLQIVTEGVEGSSLCAGASVFNDKLEKKKKKKEKKVRADKEVAKDMLESIGAIILENKTEATKLF